MIAIYIIVVIVSAVLILLMIKSSCAEDPDPYGIEAPQVKPTCFNSDQARAERDCFICPFNKDCTK